MKKPLIIVSIVCLLLNNTLITKANTIWDTSDTSTTINVNTNAVDEDKPTWLDNGPSVHSDAAIVMEASTGAILYSKNIHETYYPASITKVLTALLAIENSSLNETVTFSKEAIFDVDLDSSRIGIDVGEELTMEQSIYGILLESANEVSYAIAEHVSGDVDSFANLMNQKARELGCLDTNFVNPHGLPDPNHYTTAYDMALISRAAIQNETFRKITGTRVYTIPPTNIQEETRYLANHHKFIKNEIPFEGAIGGKTGYTSVAKYTLVTFAERNGMTLISVIMHCDTSRNQYTDTANILNYAFNNFTLHNITEVENPLTNESPLFTKYSPLFNMSSSSLQLGDNGNVVLPNNVSFDDVQKEITLIPNANIKEGDNIIGTISYTYAGTKVGSVNIVYHNVPSSSLLKTVYKSPVTDTTSKAGTPTDNKDTNTSSIKPIIIGVIVGLLVLVIGLYIIIFEIPYHKRRNAYKQRKERNKKSSDQFYIDL